MLDKWLLCATKLLQLRLGSLWCLRCPTIKWRQLLLNHSLVAAATLVVITLMLQLLWKGHHRILVYTSTTQSWLLLECSVLPAHILNHSCRRQAWSLFQSILFDNILTGLPIRVIDYTAKAGLLYDRVLLILLRLHLLPTQQSGVVSAVRLAWHLLIVDSAQVGHTTLSDGGARVSGRQWSVVAAFFFSAGRN